MSYLVALDFDGVIADSWRAHLNAYVANFAHFGRRFPIRTQSGWRRYYDSAWENNYLKNGFKLSELPEVLENYDLFLTYNGVRLFRGIDRVIKTLADEFKLVVVSTTSKKFILNKLREEGLDRYFKAIVGGRGVSDKTMLLQAALKVTRIRPSNAVMIGDSPSDIIAGKRVGARTIGVAYGWISTRRVTLSKPDVVVSRPREIITAVNEVF